MSEKEKVNKIINLAKRMRRSLLEISLNCGEAAHIGGGLSIVDIIATLYGDVLNLNLKNPIDRFILSKGHGFLGLLSALHCVGYIKKDEAMKFQTNGSELIAHPIMNPEIGIESSNGSLGQGLSYATGLAIAYKKKKKEGTIFTLVGDGECYEGSIWEAAITATETNLENLVLIVDNIFSLIFTDCLPKLKASKFSSILTEFNLIAFSIELALIGINPD